jgi:16S rRNA (adenine1518-N6/adenine1519-N6)-dimethyltransferase
VSPETQRTSSDHGGFVDARAILRRHSVRPDTRLGQNFLVDPAALERVMQAAELDAGDAVLEIGAGVGTLTARLARDVRCVVAVELDGRLIVPLREVVAGLPNVEVIQADALQLDLARQMHGEPFRVVANIPYQITSHLLRQLMETPAAPDRVVLTLQAEVVDRIMAAAGEMSLLALSIQVYGAPRRMAAIPAGAFFPVPQVDSAVLRIDRHPSPVIPADLIPSFFRLARAGFQQRRKQLRNSLASGLGIPAAEASSLLERAAIRPDRRAQELALEDWGRLARCLTSVKGEGTASAEPAV